MAYTCIHGATVLWRTPVHMERRCYKRTPVHVRQPCCGVVESAAAVYPRYRPAALTAASAGGRERAWTELAVASSRLPSRAN